MNTLSKTTKTILGVTGALVLVAVSTLATIVILRQFEPVDAPQNTTVGTSPAPDVLLKQYSDSDAIQDRVTSYRTLALPTVSPDDGVLNGDSNEPLTLATNTSLIYSKEGMYSTRISVLDNIQYARTDTSLKDNSESLKSTTVAFLGQNGMVQRSTDTSVPGIVYTNFESSNLECQISDADSSVYGTAVYGLACGLKSAVTDTYKELDSLIALNTAASDKPSSVISDKNIAEGNKELLTLNVIYGNKAMSLIFASLDGVWEFIGEKVIQNPDDESSFVIPESVTKNISDPKWDGFLIKNLQ